MQNEVDNSGIKGLEEQDLGTVTVKPKEKETVSSFPQFTDQEKSKRGLEDFRTLKKNFKSALPHIPNLAQEFAPGADLLRYFGVLGDIGGEQTFQPSTKENVATGIKKIKEGQKVEGVVDVATSGLETLGAVSDVMILGAGFTGPLAPVLVAGGVALKGITETGMAILKSKKGKTFFAKIKGEGIQNTPRKDGEGFEQTVEVERIIASSPEDIEELGNTDNLPVTYSKLSPVEIIEAEGRTDRFKSRLNEAIDTLQNKASGEQFLKTLEKKGNFSQEELEQSGLKEFLLNAENKNKTISLADVKSYMNNNTPSFVVERRVRYPSGGQDDVPTDMTFDSDESVNFYDSGRYEGEIEQSQEYIFDNRTGSPVNDLLVYKLKERDGVTTGPDEANFFQFADQAQVKKERIKEIEDNAKALIEDIPSYAEVTSQTDLFDPDKTKRFLEMGEDEYYEQAIKDKRDKLDSQTVGYDALEERYFLDQDGFITEEYARTAYDDQPEMIYTDSGTGYQIIGDEAMGYYSIRREDGEYIDTDATSYEEARIQAQQDALDRGVLEYEYDDEMDAAEAYGRTLWHSQARTDLGTEDSYEELPYRIKSRKSSRETFFGRDQGHFRQENNVGHIRTALIDPSSPQAKNRSIFLVEEFQNDPVNVARKEDGFKPTKKNINEIQKIVGDDEIGQNTSGVINITGSDGTLYSYSRDPFETGSIGGFTNMKMIEGQGTTLIKHPKNNEILAYLKKNNINPKGSVSADIPYKTDGYKFNFRLALAEAVDKKQSHMHYVAGETHALRYGEAIPLDSIDRVPDKLLKDEYKTFVREVNEGRYNDDRLRYDYVTGESRVEYVAGRDGTEIALPFDPNLMSPKYKGKLEGYAQDRTQEDFFDDIMMVDINLLSKVSTRDNSVTKQHLMVNKKTDEILGVFYSDKNPNMRRAPQDKSGKMFSRTYEYFSETGLPKETIREMGDSFKLKESENRFRGKSQLPDKISKLLTKDELEKLKKDSTEENYLDVYADISTEGRVIGGQGKKDLYNNMIKKYGDKYLKKIDPDAKIYFELMTDRQGNVVPTYGFEITDKIRKHILTEGIESFSKGGAVIILRNNKKKPQTKKYIPQIFRKNYGAFVDKQHNSYDIIDG